MIGTAAAVASLLALMALVAVLSVLVGHSTCTGATAEAPPSGDARRGIPASCLRLYRRAGKQHGVPWQVLAGIGSIESDHGRSRAPGVRAGVNSHGCCAGPMQFNLRDGRPSTWDRYGVDGNRDGTRDVYDPRDAIASAANYLRALLRNAGGNVSQTVFGYNHSQAYVNDVLARARTYVDMADGDAGIPAVDPSSMAGCGGGIDVALGPARLGVAERVFSPRAFRALPPSALAGGSGPAAVDARIYNDIVWMLRRYHLRVTAAREAGHRTHGDGTAVDLVPADGTTQAAWDASAGRLAHDLGWAPACARAGTRPDCRLAPAIQFVGYDGLPPPRLSPDLRARLRGAPAHLVGVAVLRHQRPLATLRMGCLAPRSSDRRRRTGRQEVVVGIVGSRTHCRTCSLLLRSGRAPVAGTGNRVSSRAIATGVATQTPAFMGDEASGARVGSVSDEAPFAGRLLSAGVVDFGGARPHQPVDEI